MIETFHPSGLAARSEPDGDVVHLQLGGTVLEVEKDVLVAITTSHAILVEKPRLGQSRYRSADAQILEARAKQEAAEDEVRRMRGRFEEGAR